LVSLLELSFRFLKLLELTLDVLGLGFMLELWLLLWFTGGVVCDSWGTVAVVLWLLALDCISCGSCDDGTD
jgi:hypothetical protein